MMVIYFLNFPLFFGLTLDWSGKVLVRTTSRSACPRVDVPRQDTANLGVMLTASIWIGASIENALKKHPFVYVFTDS